MQLLERFMSRYWANFARTGDPMNDSGAEYSKEQNEIYEKDGALPQWDAFNNDLTTLHLGYNTRTPGYDADKEENNQVARNCQFQKFTKLDFSSSSLRKTGKKRFVNSGIRSIFTQITRIL